MIHCSKNRETSQDRQHDVLPLDRQLTSQLFAIASSHCESRGGCHGPDHLERVHGLVLCIGKRMGARLEILSPAAILHDIGRKHESEQKGLLCHAAIGAELARTILTDLNFSKQDREEIIHCIATHRYRGTNIPLTTEAKILYDADKLDSIGATGIGRAFLFAGQIGARLHNTKEDIKGSKPYTEEDTAYREFQVKLRKIRKKMLTQVGQEMAAERHAFMELYFERLNQESGLFDSIL